MKFGSVHTDESYQLTINTTETLLQILAGSSNPISIRGIRFTTKGTDALGEPILLQLLRQTTAGTASSATIAKTNGTTATIQATAQKTFTAEPTASDIVRMWEVHPAGGGVDLWIPPGVIEVNGAARIALRVIVPNASSSAVKATAGLDFSE